MEIDAGTVCDLGEMRRRICGNCKACLAPRTWHRCALQPRSCSISLKEPAQFCFRVLHICFLLRKEMQTLIAKNSDGREQIWWLVHHAEAVHAFGSVINLPSDRVYVGLSFPKCTVQVIMVSLIWDAWIRRCGLCWEGSAFYRVPLPCPGIPVCFLLTLYF